MIWDYNVKTVVLLGAFEASNEFPMFWPDSEEETIKCDQFKVAFREREEVSLSQNGPSIGVGMDFILQVQLMIFICQFWKSHVYFIAIYCVLGISLQHSYH